MTGRQSVGWACGVLAAALITAVPRIAPAFFGVESCLNGGVHLTEPGLPGCWFLGEAGQSCAQACRSHGLVYDEQTGTVAGSGPDATFEACDTILALLGHPGSVYDPPCPAGVGCYYDTGAGQNLQCTSPPTTADAAAANAERACACRLGATAPALSGTGLRLAVVALLGAGLWTLRRKRLSAP